MDIIVGVALPVSLAIIMFSLGIGLTFADFKRVFTNFKAFGVGAFCQVIIVPAATFAVVTAFGLSGELAAGFMLLSLCPGGVTSNVISKFAKGDVALSVSLTAVVSLLSILTVPIAIVWTVSYFMGDQAPEISVASVAIAMFVITAVPVAIGVTIRHFAANAANRIEPAVSMLAGVLFVVIVLAAVAANWSLFTENLARLGPALIVMNVVLMLLGLGIATVMGLNLLERRTVSIEAGIQNSTVAITLAPIIMGTTAGFPVLSLPGAVYGITMYAVALPFVLAYRRS